MPTVTTHKRGFFGRFWQILFWTFQAAMIGLTVLNINVGSDVSVACMDDPACQAGAVIGTGAAAFMGWMVWLLGTIVLGILMLATRGKLVTREI